MDFVLFFATAAVAIGGALGMLLSKNAVHSALYLLLNFAAIAILYLLLYSPFLFTVQLTVYAGAIMVLFLFVVMLLGAEKAEDSSDALAWQRPLALILTGTLLVMALFIAGRTTGQPVPDPAQVEALSDTKTIGAVLFTEYLFPFQVTGVILLVAVIGVVVLNQRARMKPVLPPEELKVPIGD